jgi:hypothetical protein
MVQHLLFWIYIHKQRLEEMCELHVHCSQKVDATQVSTNRWIDKQNMFYTYTDYNSAFERKEIDTCCNMDELLRYATEWNKLYDYTYMSSME